MEFQKQTIIRKFLMWYFGAPANPWVSVTGVIDFALAQSYLASLSKSGSSDVTVNHLLAATVGRVLTDFPQANARIIRNRIQRLEHVDMVMPVHLPSSDTSRPQELSVAHVEHIESQSLKQIAAACRQTVSKEKAGRPQHRFVRRFKHLANELPYPVVASGLDVLAWLSRRPFLAEQIFQRIPVSTVLSNPGALFGHLEGPLLRSISASLPHRLFHLGTLWAVSALQNEVIAVDGLPKVRPVLPIILLFDHRLFDGVIAGYMLKRFAEILKQPALFFGEDGRTPPGLTMVDG